jgi:hypothetical protein
LSITDADYNASAENKGIVTFTGVKLKNSELVSPEFPSFSIGVKTQR